MFFSEENYDKAVSFSNWPSKYAQVTMVNLNRMMRKITTRVVLNITHIFAHVMFVFVLYLYCIV